MVFDFPAGLSGTVDLYKSPMPKRKSLTRKPYGIKKALNTGMSRFAIVDAPTPADITQKAIR